MARRGVESPPPSTTPNDEVVFLTEYEKGRWGDHFDGKTVVVASEAHLELLRQLVDDLEEAREGDQMKEEGAFLSTPGENGSFVAGENGTLE